MSFEILDKTSLSRLSQILRNGMWSERNRVSDDTSGLKKYRAFRAEVQAFLDREYTPEMRVRNIRQAGLFAHPDLGMEWHRILARRGWIAPTWPKESGGPGWDAVERFIFESACAAAGTPALAQMGLTLVGPALIKFGTDEQKARFLPLILSGEYYFCQGFSEPGSGSDLASLTTSAARDGDDYVVDGSKIWTTHAHNANWIFVLVKTRHESKPQAGMSFLLCAMDTPGISIRPIISISGEHELNQTFFDSVRVPTKNLIYEENRGWDVTKYLLEFERGGVVYSAGVDGLLAQARTIDAGVSHADATPDEQSGFRRKAAELEIRAMAIGASEERLAQHVATGGRIGDVPAAMSKIAGTQTMQAATELCMESLGYYAMVDQRDCLAQASNMPVIGPDFAAKPTAKYLNARASTIYGGSTEILKNVITKAGLEL